MIAIIYFIYGLLFGSFYNVVIYRIPNNMKISDGNSKCPHCNTRIKARYLIPVFSWVFLRGKSSCCNQKISYVYPVVELLTGIAFLSSYLYYGPTLESIYYIGLFSCLIIIGMIDLQHKYIYDNTLIFFLLFAIGVQFVSLVFDINFKYGLVDSLLGASISYCFYFLIHIVSKKIYKEEVFGMGDVLYITVIGFYLGARNIFFIMFGPFYVALFYFVFAKFLLKQDLGLKSQIPFGPFISVSTVIIAVFNSLY